LYKNFFIYCGQRLAEIKFPTDAMLLLDTVQNLFPKIAFIEVLVQTKGRPPNHCCHGEAVSITYSECVFVALVIQHAKRMGHFVIRCLSGCTIFFRLSHKCHDFRGKKLIVHKMWIFIFSTTLSEIFLIIRRIGRDYYHKCAHIFL